MDIQNESRRLLDAEDGDEDLTGLMSEQDAYLRSVNTTKHSTELSVVCFINTNMDF